MVPSTKAMSVGSPHLDLVAGLGGKTKLVLGLGQRLSYELDLG